MFFCVFFTVVCEYSGLLHGVILQQFTCRNRFGDNDLLYEILSAGDHLDTAGEHSAVIAVLNKIGWHFC